MTFLASCLCLPLFGQTAVIPQGAAGLELHYRGDVRLDEPGAEPLKEFTLLALVTGRQSGGRQIGYLVDERGRGRWPWPERFGIVELAGDNRPLNPEAGPSLLYDLDGTLNPVPIALPLFAFTDRLQQRATWTDGPYEYSVGGMSEVGGRTCWEVTLTHNFPRRVMYVEDGTGLLVALEEHVFLGMGQEFILTLELESAEGLSAEPLAREQAPLAALAALRGQMQRAAGTTSPELNPADLDRVSEALDAIVQAAEATAFRRLVLEIDADLARQSRRDDAVAGLVEQLVGSETPEFQLPLLGGQMLTHDDLAGHVVVLHFWDYRYEPLIEPYGQIGYLDFLYSRRREAGVRVIGVAVDSRVGDPREQRDVEREVRRLRSFMNLAYPIALDNGDVLAAFGDPRRVDAELPLWVVIAPDGTVAGCHVGFYDIDADLGLRELDELVGGLIERP